MLFDNVALTINLRIKVFIGDITKRYKDLDIIPSPYLDGTLDKFIDDEFSNCNNRNDERIEFPCTYCAWGDDWLRASNKYSTER